MERVLILGTGLLGGSVGLALRAAGFSGSVIGWDRDEAQSATAQRLGAIDAVAADPLEAARKSDVILLSGPVFSILDWQQQLACLTNSTQLITDVGSTKQQITAAAIRLFNQPETAGFLPGHPMAGKEVSGAEYAEAGMLKGAVWLFTEAKDWQMAPQAVALAAEWREWVVRFGCRTRDLDAPRHDEICAWVSHLPQYVSTALSALLEDRFGADEDMRAIGGRALREMTRLGSSPYSMWRDVAHTNTEAVAAALLALEQRLLHLRENLKTPELREEFEKANRFRLPPRE